MMFGTATNILAAPGLVSAASKAAQKGKVLMVTVDANGNLATAAVPVAAARRSSGRRSRRAEAALGVAHSAAGRRSNGQLSARGRVSVAMKRSAHCAMSLRTSVSYIAA